MNINHQLIQKTIQLILTPQHYDNEITKQVVGHLKSIPGIKVFGRNAMEEFLKTHNIAGLQQMVDNNSQIKKTMTKTENKIPPKPKDYPFNDYCWQNDQKVKEAYLKQPIYSREEVLEHMRIAREELEKRMEEERKQKEKNKKD